MNELINKDNEWIIHFMSSLDRKHSERRKSTYFTLCSTK